MARKKTIDNDQILDAAEIVLLRDGVQRFTLDAVALQAGISKGGLVYSFPSKDLLIHTLMQRELARFTQEADYQALRLRECPDADILGYITAIQQETDAITSRAIGLHTALVHAPDMLTPVREFYRARLTRLAAATPLTQRLRLAFLAAEGIFLLHGTGLAPISREERQAMLDDAYALASSAAVLSPGRHDPLRVDDPRAYRHPLPTPGANDGTSQPELSDDEVSQQAIDWLAAHGVSGASTVNAGGHARAAHIVTAAANLIRHHGLGALTHRAVAAEAKVPLGSTTYHFQSLDDILNAVMREAIAHFRDDMYRWFYTRRQQDPCEVLTDFVLRGTEDIQDLAREYELFTAAISRPSLRPMALEWSNTVVAIMKLIVPKDAALPLGTLMNGFFIRALLERHERPLARQQVHSAITALYTAFR